MTPKARLKAAMNAEAGIVKIHAHTMLPATPQRTAEARRVEPTPDLGGLLPGL